MYKTIRVDIKYLDEQEVIKRTQEIVDIVERCYIVVETATISKKRHIQGMLYVEDDKKIHDRIRNIIRNKLLNKQGTKEDYSYATVKQYDDYMIYLSKGEDGKPPQTIYIKGITEEAVKVFRETAVMKQEAFTKVQKNKQQNKVQAFKEYYENECLPRVAERDYRFKYDEIIDDILNFFNNKEMLFRQQLVEQYLNLVFNCYVRKYQEAHYKAFTRKLKESLQYNAYFEEFYKFI